AGASPRRRSADTAPRGSPGDGARALSGGLRRRALVRPISSRGLRARELLSGLEPRGHRSLGAREHLVVVDIQKTQPALLAKRKADEAAELDELGLAEVPVQARPERVVGVEAVDDRLGVRERRFL